MVVKWWGGCAVKLAVVMGFRRIEFRFPVGRGKSENGGVQSKARSIWRDLLHEMQPCIAVVVLAIAPFVKCEVDGRGDVYGRFVRGRGVTYVEEILNILLPGESRGVGDPERQKV